MKSRLFALAFVIIPSGLVSTDALAQLQVGAGAHWNHSGNVYTVLSDVDLAASGTITDVSGTMKFAGAGDNFLSGSSALSLYNIEMSKAGMATLYLQQDFIAGGNILFTSGLIDLYGRVITLAPSARLVNESEASRITGTGGGYIAITTNLNAPAGVNRGNLGAEITSSQDLGSTTIRRGHQSQQNGAGNGNSIYRYFDVLPANNTGLNATLRLHYFDAELNGLTEGSLATWSSPNNTTWTNRGFSARDVTANYVDRDAINNFSRWTLSSPVNALPVVFASFQAACSNGATILRWQTDREEHTRRFDIQRSSDGVK
jgi:hypothetical protein